MNDVLNRIRNLIDDKAGGKVSEFHRLTKINDSTIRGWFRFKTTPSPDNVLKICQACGVTSDWLLYGTEPSIPDIAIDKHEQKGNDPHDKLNSDNAFLIDPTVIQAIPGAFKLSGKFRPVPVLSLDEVVRVGFDTMKGKEVVMIPQEWSSDEKAYAVEVIDDSMEPMYCRGDCIVVSPALLPVQGRGALIKLQSRITPVIRLWQSQQNGLAMLKTCTHPEHEIAIRQGDIEFAHKIIIKFEGG